MVADVAATGRGDIFTFRAGHEPNSHFQRHIGRLSAAFEISVTMFSVQTAK
jgi:hypothetical protein